MFKKTIAFFLSLICLFALAAPAAQATQWPTKDFTTAPVPDFICPPELELLFVGKGITEGNVLTDSMLILHKGNLVYERYAGGWDKDKPHAMYSVTKSVVSALVGVAIQEGKIKSVQDKVIDYYPDAVIAPGEESKKDMTIEHLLTMTSGLPGDSDKTDVSWWDAKDSGKAAFETPQKAQPGKRFSYSSGPSMQTLACLISRAVGKNLFDYAKEKLFGPLGMTSVTWDAAADGNTYGGFGLSMTSRDMLRFGYLYLNEGNRDGQQILLEGWVTATAPPSLGGKNYGYLFWDVSYPCGLPRAYQCKGTFGQFILVVPEWDAVIVRTGSAGPITRSANELAYKNSLFDAIFVKLIRLLMPLEGLPLAYFRAAV